MTDFYFASDGNWGGADGLVVVDASKLDEHFTDYADVVGEYDRSAWAEWFSKNDHPIKGDGEYGTCHYCDWFEVGSLADIDAKFREEK